MNVGSEGTGGWVGGDGGMGGGGGEGGAGWYSGIILGCQKWSFQK